MAPLPWFDIFVVAYFLWVIVACVTLLLDRRSPTATLAWIVAFIAIPVVSGLYYMVFGPRRLQRRRRRYSVARGSIASRLGHDDGAPLPKLDPDAAGLAAVARRLDQGDPTFASAVALLDNGDAFFTALEESVRGAQHHIHMEYYIWEPDEIGVHFRDLLAQAAARKVEVRVLYDSVGSKNCGAGFWKPVREAGGEVREFNRLHLSIAGLNFANFRTHRKIAVFDGITGYLGGINLHSPASAARSGKGAWRDEQARIEGEPVHRIQRAFLENWNYSRGAFKLTSHNMAKYFPATRIGKGSPVQIICSGPDDPSAPLYAFYLAALSTARERVLIETPYLIPDEPLETALRIAELRGVEVEVIVPKIGDSRIVTAASHTYCESLRKSGIDVYQYGPPMIHAKTMVVDRTAALVGTANLDNRSFRLNFEIAAVFYDRDIIDRLVKRFEADREKSRPFPLRRRPERLTALFESIARLTSPVL